jgi:hypothetical protein
MMIPWETCYSIESSQSLKVRKFLQVENPSGRYEENDVLNSQHWKIPKSNFIRVRYGF